MSEEKEELITYSEAARRRKVSAQNISNLVKRKRLIPVLVGDKKLLRAKDVENLEKGVGGRPEKAKRNTFAEMMEEINLAYKKREKPEEHYPQLYKELFKYRKPIFDPNYVTEESTKSPFASLIWRKNRKKLRKSLQYPMYWKVINEPLVNNCVIRAYKDSFIQNFYDFSLNSQRMNEKHFFITMLKYDFLSFTEFQLNIVTNEAIKRKRERELIVAMYNECMDKECSGEECKGREANPLISGYKIILVIHKDETIFSGLDSKEKTEKIKRILNESTKEFRTKSTVKIISEWRKVQREIQKSRRSSV
jgi:hypothetical protein